MGWKKFPIEHSSVQSIWHESTCQPTLVQLIGAVEDCVPPLNYDNDIFREMQEEDEIPEDSVDL